MIKNIFMPERSGQYYLFSSRTIGVTIGSSSISAVQIKSNGSKRIIEKMLSVAIENNTQAEYQERAAQALQMLFQQLDAADHIVSTLPSMHVVFKKLHIPFVDREKIAQVINFEVEPLLPFPLNQAAIDFIITAQASDGKSAEVFIAAAQKDAINAHKAIFELANIIPTQVTVDIFSLYSLITTIPAYTAIKGGLVLLIIGTNTTCVTLIRNSQLVLIRTLPKGTNHLAKILGTELAIAPEVAIEELVRFGVEHANDPKKHEAIRKALGSYFDEISFTINSFSAEENSPVESIIILGPGSQINGLLPFASELMHIPCQSFNTQLIFDTGIVQSKSGEQIATEYIIPLSAALRTASMIDFNLAPTELSPIDIRLFLKQSITTIILICVFFGILGTQYITQRRVFKREIKASQEQTIAALKKQFKDVDSKELARVIEDSQEAVTKEESTWFAFSSTARSSMLTILLELKTRIDKDALGFVLEKLSITQDSITLKAHVRDHNALQLFEKALQNSELLNNFEPQRDPSFEMKITLPSSHREEE